MVAHLSPKLLMQTKSWQLICLGVSGWLALYGAAMTNWPAWRNLVGNSQGGCFAIVMSLAGVEVKRFKRRQLADDENLRWASCLTTAQINAHLAQVIQSQDFRVEPPGPEEAQAGFGVLTVNAGRTVAFETDRWREPVIDIEHAVHTDENRKKIRAHLAVIVGIGEPAAAVSEFTKTHPVQLLAGNEFKRMMKVEGGSPI